MADYLTAPLMGEALGLPIKKKKLAQALTSGQARTAWLNDKARKAEDTLGYYLGPAAKPIEALGAVLDFTDAGDMVAAADASRELWNNPSIGSAANYAAAGAAMALPFYSARIGQGVADLADDARRFVTDEDGAIRLWHGSPHDFDKFSMDAIGTGEGAQAYGHGLYFAENRGVAEAYRDILSGSMARNANSDRPSDIAFGAMRQFRGDRKAAADWLAQNLQDVDLGSSVPRYEQAISILRSGDEIPPPGRLYEVNVNANPEDFLDWDAPLSAQPEKVREALAAMDPDTYSPGGVDYDPTELGQITYQRLQNQKRDYGIDAGKADLTTLGGSQRGATDDLQGFGIPGIRYLDAGSRGAEDGSRNYVVFDDRLVNILGKDGARTTAEGKAQTVLDMLAEGRASEITDDMLDLGDPVLNARLNMYLFENYDLPMDEASRMARAGEMGFDAKTYRGDRRDILGLTRFDGQSEGGPGVLFSSDEARVANTYAPRVPNPSGEIVIPLSVRSGGYRESGYTKPFPAEGTEAEMDDWMRGLDVFDKRIAQPGVKNAIFERDISAARTAEQPGVVFRQVVDDRIDTGIRLPSDVYATLDPTAIRSRFARFDPRLAHLRNLSAGVGALTFGNVLSQDEEETLKDYLGL